MKEYQQRMKAVTRSFDLNQYDFTYFPRYSEMVEFMKELVRNRKYSEIIKIGNTFENKVIYAMKVEKSPEKPVSKSCKFQYFDKNIINLKKIINNDGYFY
jgi:hypothetical protein